MPCDMQCMGMMQCKLFGTHVLAPCAVFISVISLSLSLSLSLSPSRSLSLSFSRPPSLPPSFPLSFSLFLGRFTKDSRCGHAIWEHLDLSSSHVTVTFLMIWTDSGSFWSLRLSWSLSFLDLTDSSPFWPLRLSWSLSCLIRKIVLCMAFGPIRLRKIALCSVWAESPKENRFVHSVWAASPKKNSCA